MKADSGMTLRDYFAGQAMAGYLPGPNVGAEHIARMVTQAYAVADAMLKARK